MNKLAPILVLYFISTAFLKAQYNTNRVLDKTASFDNSTVIITEVNSNSAVDVFEFVSGRSLDVKSKENHESEYKQEINPTGLLIKSRLVKKMFKKISILNQSVC